METENNESFTSKHKLRFDTELDEWIFQVPNDSVTLSPNGSYEIHLPVYASRAMAIGGNILRNVRKEYREWLLLEQKGLCAICGKGDEIGNPWNLDHQPPLAKSGSKFIDYAKMTQNRVIHQKCDSAQNSKISETEY